MKELLLKNPIRNINGILDYIGESSHDAADYIENYEDIAVDRSYLADSPSTEIEIILNCCELLIELHKVQNEVESIIDVGCGFGHVLNQIEKLPLMVGVDISYNRLKNLREDITKIRSFAENIPFRSDSFDLAICTDIFEHVEDEKPLVEELYRIIKPGGLLFFACPWKQDLSVYDLKEYKERFKDYKYKHLRSVNETTIEENFKKFKIISSTEIVSHMEKMLFEPYSIKFIIFKKI